MALFLSNTFLFSISDFDSVNLKQKIKLCGRIKEIVSLSIISGGLESKQYLKGRECHFDW